MKLFISTLLLAIIIFCACNNKGDNNGVFTARNALLDTLVEAEAISDFKTFRTALETVHPALYKYTDKAVMDKLLDSLQGSIKGTLQLVDLYNKLRVAIGAVKCGHTYVEFGERMRMYHQNVDVTCFAQLNLLYNDGRYYIQSTDSSSNLGTLESVGGHTMNDIFNRLRAYGNTDAGTGSIDSFNLASDFYYKYYLCYDEPTFKRPSDGYNKSYLTFSFSKNGVVKTDSVQRGGFKIASLYAGTQYMPDFPANVGYDLAINDSAHYAVLTVNSFNFSGAGADAFKHFAQNSFALLAYKKNIRKLIIDLRNNEGGDADLMGYLARFTLGAPFKECRSATTKVRDIYKLPFDFDILNGSKEFVDSVLTHNYDSVAPNTYTLNAAKMRQYIPAGTLFTGKVIILTNHATFSAATNFASLHRDGKTAIIVGEEPKGDYQGLNCYYQFEIPLPKSELRVVIPVVAVQFDLRHSDTLHIHSLVPDFIVHQSISDLQHDIDTQKKFAEKLN